MSLDPLAPITATPSLDMTMGATFIGLIITAMLYGISVPQLVIYYRRYSKDPRLFQYSIGLLWIFDTIQLGLAILALYFYLVTSHGNYQALLQLNWSIRSQYPFSMATVVGVQPLYAVRIWKFGRHYHSVRLLPWCGAFTQFVSFAATLAGGIYSTYINYGPHDLLTLPSIRVPLYIAFVATAITDLVVAGIMCFYLHKGKGTTRLSRTIKIIIGLTWLVVMSGLVTCVCSLLVLITYIIWPNALLFVAFEMVLPKIYMNSLLAMLNSRKIPRTAATDWEHSASPPGTVLEFSPLESNDIPT
ncbi:uncharacterized protein EV420DRAFT_515798 [Desarmillaria tabescens]|uniref:DUF6534 domain-containing protein n=1 Tax=Armillaria tabescens TaxID=1929756 RepID=A0AA39KC56_ARMTA|nr:uncharacterized protein EV420DRAFT_515798 [Desarmillaria tabescens]KAK0457260.1 hypothetical protein EV420DRAFT_515798 [Desarmillaria tabescens]